MKKKSDYVANNYIAEFFKEFTNVIDAKAGEVEDYKWDVSVSSTTDVFDAEVKRICRNTLKDGDGWYDWYNLSNDKGIKKNLLCFPPWITTGDSVYILNAEDTYKNPGNSKIAKMLTQGNVYLIYLAKDGILLFTPSDLKQAVLGYAYFLNKSHGTSLNAYHNRIDPHYELKALIDLNRGRWYPREVPPEIFE